MPGRSVSSLAQWRRDRVLQDEGGPSLLERLEVDVLPGFLQSAISVLGLDERVEICRENVLPRMLARKSFAQEPDEAPPLRVAQLGVSVVLLVGVRDELIH